METLGWAERDRREVYRRGLTIRALAAGTILVFFGLVPVLGEDEEISGIAGVLWTLGGLVLINPILWEIGERRGFPIGEFYIHWCGDVLAATLIVHYLGILDVPMAAAGYMIMIVSSATFATMGTAFALATFASLCYVSLSVAESVGLLTHHHVAFAHHLSNEARFFSISGVVVLFHIFAYLGGTLASQLRAKTEETVLQKKRLEESYGKERLAREGMVLLSTLVQHDVYSPLGVVSGACNEAMESCNKGDMIGAAYYMEMVRKRLRSIEAAVRTLGLFHQPQAVVSDHEMGCELRDIVVELKEDLRGDLEERQVKLTIGGIWPCVTLGQERVYHVLRNLLSNAIKWVPDDGTGRVFIWADRETSGANDWTISVEDNGPGLPDDIMDKILTSAPPVLGKRRPTGGFGAGLALSRNLVLSWGGRLSYKPGVSGGSVFTVNIPSGVITGVRGDASRG